MLGFLFGVVVGAAIVLVIVYFLIFDDSKTVLRSYTEILDGQFQQFKIPEQLKTFLTNPDLREKLKSEGESCIALSLLTHFLYQEFRDTKSFRKWCIRKLQMEFNDMSSRSGTNKILHDVKIRDLALGRQFPVIKAINVPHFKMAEDNNNDIFDELDLILDIEYNGSARVCVDVQAVFGRRALLSVQLQHLSGDVQIRFRRWPYSHWSVAFVDQPALDFKIEPTLGAAAMGRPLRQMIPIIEQQMRRLLQRKHVMPNFKMRYRPFFPNPLLVPTSSAEQFQHIHITGDLQISLLDVDRLNLTDVPTGYTQLFVQISVGVRPFLPGANTHFLCLAIKLQRYDANAPFGVELNKDIIPEKSSKDRYVYISSVLANSEAENAGLKPGDILVAINNVPIRADQRQNAVMRLLTKTTGDILLIVERSLQNVDEEDDLNVYAGEEPGTCTSEGKQAIDDAFVLVQSAHDVDVDGNRLSVDTTLVANDSRSSFGDNNSIESLNVAQRADDANSMSPAPARPQFLMTDNEQSNSYAQLIGVGDTTSQHKQPQLVASAPVDVVRSAPAAVPANDVLLVNTDSLSTPNTQTQSQTSPMLRHRKLQEKAFETAGSMIKGWSSGKASVKGFLSKHTLPHKKDAMNTVDDVEVADVAWSEEMQQEQSTVTQLGTVASQSALCKQYKEPMSNLLSSSKLSSSLPRVSPNEQDTAGGLLIVPGSESSAMGKRSHSDTNLIRKETGGRANTNMVDNSTEEVRVYDEKKPPASPKPTVARHQSDASVLTPRSTFSGKLRRKASHRSTKSKDTVEETGSIASNKLDYESEGKPIAETVHEWNERFTFKLQDTQKHINVAVYARVPKDILNNNNNNNNTNTTDKQHNTPHLIAHTSICLPEVLEYCATTLSNYQQQCFPLKPADSAKVPVEFVELSRHRGFDPRLCYGDVRLAFRWFASGCDEQEQRMDDAIHGTQTNANTLDTGTVLGDGESTDIDTLPHHWTAVQLQQATVVCALCKGKIWLKSALQCARCEVCIHSKCQTRAVNTLNCAPAGPSTITEQDTHEELTSSNEHTPAQAQQSGGRRWKIQQKLSEKLQSTTQHLRKRRLAKDKDTDTDLDTGSLGEDVQMRELQQPWPGEYCNAPYTDNQSIGGDRASMQSDTTSLSGHDILQHLHASAANTPTPTGVCAEQSQSHTPDNTPQLYTRGGTYNEHVINAAKTLGKDLFADLQPEPRKDKINEQIDRIQSDIDDATKERVLCVQAVRAATNPAQRTQAQNTLAHVDDRVQSLAVLMLHYCSGLQNCLDQIEALEVVAHAEADAHGADDTSTAPQANHDQLLALAEGE